MEFPHCLGQVQPSRWGLRGAEDLGGGTSAIFILENGFSVLDGSLGQGGREFGRQAFVGLNNNAWGTLTLGRQYSPLGDALRIYESSVLWADTGAHIGDADNVFDTFRINNAVKYSSPIFAGVQLSGLYATSNDAGSFADNRAYSFGLSYNVGQLSLGVAYMELNSSNSSDNPNGAVFGDYATIFRASPLKGNAGMALNRIAGIGGSYGFEKLSIAALATTSRFDYVDGESLRIDNYEVNGTYRPTPFGPWARLYLYPRRIRIFAQLASLASGQRWGAISAFEGNGRLSGHAVSTCRRWRSVRAAVLASGVEQSQPARGNRRAAAQVLAS
jgi:GBP family porin